MPVVSNFVPSHANIKREISPPSKSSPSSVSRPSNLLPPQVHQSSHHSTQQNPLKSPFQEQIPQQQQQQNNNNIVQSVQSKEILEKKISDDKKINENQYGLNVNDFMPVSDLSFDIQHFCKKKFINRKRKILVKSKLLTWCRLSTLVTIQ